MDKYGRLWIVRMYRASGIGGCIKAQVAAQLGFTALDTSKKMENWAREGALHEKAVLQHLKESGVIVVGEQQEVTLPILKEVTIVGHVDAVGIEVKSMSKDVFAQWQTKKFDMGGIMEKYKWQISVYMHALNMPFTLAVKDRNSGELDLETIDEPFYSMQDILGRMLEIEKWVRRGELPNECSASMYPCPFYYLEQQKSLELTEDEVLDDLVQMYEEAKVAVKAATERVNAAREAIREGMGDREKVETEKSKVTTYQGKRRELDANKMREAGIAVDDYWIDKFYSAVRVTVKERADDRTEPGRDSVGEEADRRVVAQPMGESSESGRDGDTT